MTRRFTLTVVLACGLIVAAAEPARAQLDPLLFIKRVPPNVIVVVDTSPRMLEDTDGYYYDPHFYLRSENTDIAADLGITSVSYRRKYLNLRYTNLLSSGPLTFAADGIVGVPQVYDPSNSATFNSAQDAKFFDSTRIGIAKRGLVAAISQNASARYRWGLMKLRQNTPSWRTTCNKPVVITTVPFNDEQDEDPCDTGLDSNYGIYDPNVTEANYAVASESTSTVVAAGAGTAQSIINVLSLDHTSPLALIPAGRSTSTFEDRPIARALADAKNVVTNLMGADAAATRSCRNSIVVLITSGANGGDAAYMTTNNAATVASGLRSLSIGTETWRVPVYVVAIDPPATDVAELQTIAGNSGGRYFNVTDADGIARAVTQAVQAGFSRAPDFNTSTPSEFTGVSPIIGTVNLVGAANVAGTALEHDEIHVDDDPTKPIVPQRSNVMITAGFSLPGFEGRIRAFRTYDPERDTTKVSGWKFVSDGTRLWPDIDSPGRPWLAGLARIPADPNTRNIYTAIPNGSGGVDVVPFTAAYAATLAPHLRLPTTTSASNFIASYRELPIGAVIGSTPALMDPPSLDPPPDTAYGRPDDSTLTFAATHKNRRAMIFVGANDGMIHAIDARTGFEVWAFVPYNLLPKLKVLLDGQGVDMFDYFVDSSPKIAEVKMNTATGHKWRSLLIIGQGPGGTFYQAFDVTEAGMTVPPDQGSLADVQALLLEFDTPNEGIQFLWSFPNYNSFDPTISASLPVTDATPGGKVNIYGDLKSTATFAEKTVGYTWSDPAVGPLDQNRTVNAVMVGSGYFPAIEGSLSGRVTGPRAGRYFYLLKVEDGTLIGNATGANCDGTGCIDAGDEATPAIKNALQADPSAAGDNGVPIVKKAYLGDLDGKYWRFNFGPTGAITKSEMINTGQPIFSSSALLFIGSADVYMFFSTGSDLLPTTSPYGVGTFKLYALKDNAPGANATIKFSYNLAAVTNNASLADGERPSTAPSVAGDIVFFTTTTESSSSPCSNFTGNLYAFTYLGGAAYDTNNNSRLDNNESPRVKQMLGRATAPFIVDQHLYLGTAGSTGFNIEMFGDTEDFNNGVGQVGIRVLSWREIR